MSLLSSGKVVPILYEPVYDGLESVTQALADLEGRKTWGKAVIRVRREQGERAKV
jgi:NADPH2:quinone reductase